MYMCVLARSVEGEPVHIPAERIEQYFKEKLDRYVASVDLLGEAAEREDTELVTVLLKHQLLLQYLKTPEGAIAYSRDVEKIREAVGYTVPIDTPGDINAWINPMECADLVS